MKVLIFGCGNQAKKYISFFKKKNYIDIITNKMSCNCKILGKKYFFEEFKNHSKININSYDLIILAVFPIDNQTEIIKYLIDKKVRTNVIIEKPVTYDLKLLKKLIKYNNITYNIEEITFSKVLSKETIKSLEIYCDNRDCTFEHALGSLLLNNKFSNILELLNYNIVKDSKILKYKLIINGGLKVLENKNGYLFLNNTKIGNIFLFDSLFYLLKILNSDINILYKYNYYLLKKWIMINGTCKNIKLSTLKSYNFVSLFINGGISKLEFVEYFNKNILYLNNISRTESKKIFNYENFFIKITNNMRDNTINFYKFNKYKNVPMLYKHFYFNNKRYFIFEKINGELIDSSKKLILLEEIKKFHIINKMNLTLEEKKSFFLKNFPYYSSTSLFKKVGENLISNIVKRYFFTITHNDINSSNIIVKSKKIYFIDFEDIIIGVPYIFELSTFFLGFDKDVIGDSIFIDYIREIEDIRIMCFLIVLYVNLKFNKRMNSKILQGIEKYYTNLYFNVNNLNYKQLFLPKGIIKE